MSQETESQVDVNNWQDLKVNLPEGQSLSVKAWRDRRRAENLDAPVALTFDLETLSDQSLLRLGTFLAHSADRVTLAAAASLNRGQEPADEDSEDPI